MDYPSQSFYFFFVWKISIRDRLSASLFWTLKWFLVTLFSKISDQIPLTWWKTYYRPEIAGEKDSNGINLPANCLLMSEDGFKFKINEQLLNQTKIMSDIIEDSNDPDCSGIIKIFFLCQVRKLWQNKKGQNYLGMYQIYFVRAIFSK